MSGCSVKCCWETLSGKTLWEEDDFQRRLKFIMEKLNMSFLIVGKNTSIQHNTISSFSWIMSCYKDDERHAYSFYWQSHDLFPCAKDSAQFHLPDDHGSSNAGLYRQIDLQNEPTPPNFFWELENWFLDLRLGLPQFMLHRESCSCIFHL